MVVKITKFLNSTDIISIQFLPNHNSLYPSYIRNYLSGQIILRKNVYKMFSADNPSKCPPPAVFTCICHPWSMWINSPRIQASAGVNIWRQFNQFTFHSNVQPVSSILVPTRLCYIIWVLIFLAFYTMFLYMYVCIP